jgi:lipid-A-disaccharide synthase
MLIAGEASGDANAAELVRILAETAPESTLTDEVQPLKASLQPRFFGAGGPKMAAAGVELAFDMTTQSVIGFSDVIKKLPVFRRMFRRLLELAADREPDVIILVDFGGFNSRFAHAVKAFLRAHAGIFYNWRPKIVQYVSPQVWASRSSRAEKLAKDIDLLLCLFPFEKAWYAQRLPRLRVECVGHPLFDRHAAGPTAANGQAIPTVVLLPGSRSAELRRHLPAMLGAARQVSAKTKVRFQMILPNEELLAQARQFDLAGIQNLELQIGGLDQSLSQATVAIASTGTVTLECAFYSVPTVAIYKTSWSTYQIGRRIIQVRFLAMPNLLADEALYPELIQHEATPENIARETLDLLTNTPRRQQIQSKLRAVINSLGGPGAAQRAAQAIVKLL